MRRLVRRAQGPTLFLLALALPLAGCDRLFDIDRLDEIDTLDNGYTCACTCTYPDGGVSTLPLDVCMPPELNPNIVDETPTPEELAADCAGRVESQIEEMSDECFDGQDPLCDCVTDPTPVTFLDPGCDAGCPEVPIDATCSNWDPESGEGTATCGDQVDCDNFGPVCLRAATPGAGPAPISARLMGRTTSVTIDGGEITVSAEGDSDSSPVAGTVYFTPADGCAPGTTCLAMDYRLEATQTIHFDGVPILGFGDTDITGVLTNGATEAFALGVSNTSFLQQDTTNVSGRAFENGDRRAATGTNDDELIVTFDGDSTVLQGNLAGSVGDPDGDSGDATVHVFATGDVENTPPVADVDTSSTVECTSPDGAEITLDATPSTDREDNVVSYGWYLGGRVGPNVGLGPELTTQQALGSETYVVKLIDAAMQGDELAVTVSVVDTTAPTIDCGAPATITPPGTVYTFPATATDVCDDDLGAAEVLDYECFSINGAGHEVRRSCKVEIDGDTLVVRSTAGVGDHVRWRVRSTDASGNETIQTCETIVAIPGQQ